MRDNRSKLMTTHHLPVHTGSSSEYELARQKVILFLVLVTVFACSVIVLRLLVPPGARVIMVTWTPRAADGLEMWSVGLAGLMTLAIIDRSLRDLGLHLGPARYFLIAAAMPVIYCTAVYVPVWVLGLGRFAGGAVLWAGIQSALIHLPRSLFFAAGEELGWRGVLVPNLARTGEWKRVVLLPGAIWAVWHYPDILFFGYNVDTPAIYAVTCFSISLLGLGAFLSWLRLVSNSVWPAVLFHGVHNAAIGGIFERSTVGDNLTAYITTEFGAGLAIASIIIGHGCWTRGLSGAGRR
jgi:uncharacterized protein